CFPHCINLAVKAGLDYLTDLILDAGYQWELERDIIAKVRKLVAACRASGPRREKLADTIREGNKEGWWIDIANRTETLRVLALLRDVDTRWSSIYYMVDCLLLLYPAVDKFITSSDSAEMKSLLLDRLQIPILREIQLFLFAFHSVQELGSAEKTPTLSIVLPLFEKLLLNLRKLPDRVPNLVCDIKGSLRRLQEYNDLIRHNPVYRLAMCK
ncbi:hypothetical protein BDZ89DRAFT_922328, partial [Hymenopellis radicata]